MNKLLPATALLVACLAVIGCNNRDPSVRTSPSVSEPDNSGSILGIDSDNSGVRDDIETTLFEQYSGDVLDAALEYAANIQSALVVDVLDKDAAQHIANQVYISENCFTNKFTEFKNISVLSILMATINTDQRKAALDRYVTATKDHKPSENMLPPECKTPDAS